jgi:hypothetical protein
MPLLARTPKEAFLYIDLHPCVCGESRFEPAESLLIQLGSTGLGRRYKGPCPRCGASREFVFRLPDWPVEPKPGPLSYGDDEPSQLIDAGEWLLLAHSLAKSISIVRGRPLYRAEREVIEESVACLDEVLKFIPASGQPPEAAQWEQPPDAAFWTERGRAYRDAQPPGTFRRGRLQAYRGGVASCLDPQGPA